MKITGDFRALRAPRKSLSDKKEYKLLTLENGLRVLLVKQEDEKKSEVEGSKLRQNLAAVALCVGSGSFQDPNEVQGLSHFLEHMIFMGSEKYSKENEFDQYVASYGGFDNAYTESEYTLFHFDIIEKHLAGALDRFSQFFISPLLSLESMEREMQAVESEFQANATDDDVRISQIFCTMIRDCHPTSNFIWGNSKTLKEGIEREKLNEKLREFRERHYVANRMFLCIQSSVDMPRLERTVEKFFSDIRRGPESLQAAESEIFKKNFHEKFFFVKSTTEKCKLLMTFQLPPVGIEIKFLEYLASLIQYEGKGSLSDYFMDELLALKVKAKVGYQSFEGNSMFTLFTIEVNLTSKGFEDFDIVLKAIFAFLLLLKTTKIEEHKTRYEEFKEIKDTLFKYRKEKSAIENVQELAVNMRFFRDEDVVVGHGTYPDFDEEIVAKFIASINERKFNLMVLSDKHRLYEKVEKWFGTEYSEIDFPKPYIKLWNERWLRNELHLPKPNDFICKNFGIFGNSISDDKATKHPQQLFKNSICECFYKLDKKFQLPHGFVHVFFQSTVTENSVANLNMTSIYSMCVKNFLSDKLFPATVVGYSYRLHSMDNGLILRLSGFNEKLSMLVDIITKTIKNLRNLMDKSVFETFKKELKKNFHNCLVDAGLLNDDCRLAVIKRNHWSFFDRYETVDELTFRNFLEFSEKFIKSLRLKILIQGNIIESRAMYLTQLVITNLGLLDDPELSQNLQPEINQIPIGTSYLKVKSLRQNDTNSVIKNYYQVGKAAVREECLTEFLVSVLNEPLFDTLRSHEQLGYGVSCSLRKNCGVLGITITVEYQENKNSANLIDEKIEEFLLNFYLTLKHISTEDFLSAKRSIVSLKLLPDSELEKEVNRHWDEIRNDENVFDRNELEAFETENLSKDEIVEFYCKIFLSPHEKRKLSVQVMGNENSTDKKKTSKMSSSEEKCLRNDFLKDVIELKQKLEVVV